MERFDNIDIFFIAIIGAYFITLACILFSLFIKGIIKLIKKLKAREEIKPVIPVVEETIQIPIADKPKNKKSKKAKVVLKKITKVKGVRYQIKYASNKKFKKAKVKTFKNNKSYTLVTLNLI